MTGRLVHVGSAVLDLVYRITDLPEPGGERIATAFHRLPGGGFNVMAAARRCGADVVYAGPHGTGPNGDMLRAAFAQEGIVACLPASPDIDTGTCVVLVTDDAERSFVSFPGAEGVVDAAALGAVRAEPGDVVFTSGYSLTYAGSRDPLARFLAGVPEERFVALDPSPVVADIPAAIVEAMLGRADWVSLNRAEAGVLVGPDTPEREAFRLLERCPRVAGIVLRSGAGGALVAMRGADPVSLPAFPVDAIDTNGAGDVHIGVFLAGLLAGTPPLEAARYANAAAALSVTRVGGGDPPTRAEVDAFLAARAP